MTNGDQARLLYRALTLLCKGTWASRAQLGDVLEYDEPKLERYLEGMVTMGELERRENIPVACEDDGFGAYTDSLAFDDAKTFTGYRLTEFGEQWAEMSCL